LRNAVNWCSLSCIINNKNNIAPLDMESLNQSFEITAELDSGKTVTGKMFFGTSRKGRFKVFYNDAMKNGERDDYADIDEMESHAIILLKKMAENTG